MNTTLTKETRQPAAQHAPEPNWLLPAVNVIETHDKYVIEAEMPGVSREGLEITLEGNTLTLTGHRPNGRLPGAALYLESKPAGFRRVFELDPTISTGKTSAHLEQGLLTVQLPKAERAHPRKIAVS
jgi:HSP20 family protein